jgi:hypothetical protein
MLNLHQFELELVFLVFLEDFELLLVKLSPRYSDFLLVRLLPLPEFIDSFVVILTNIGDLYLPEVHVLQFDHQILVLMLALGQIDVHILNHIYFISVSTVLLL